MGDDEHSHPGLGQVDHRIKHLFDHLGVEGRGGLVKEHDLGLHGQCAGDGGSLLLAAGKLARMLVGLFRDAYLLQQFHRFLFSFLPRPFAHSDGRQSDVVQDRQMGEEVELLKDHADLTADGSDVADIMGEFNAIHDDLTALVLLQPINGADEGGLAGAGRAENDDDLPLLHGHVDALQRVKVAEPLMHVAANDDFVGARRCWTSISHCGSHSTVNRRPSAPRGGGWFRTSSS